MWTKTLFLFLARLRSIHSWGQNSARPRCLQVPLWCEEHLESLVLNTQSTRFRSTVCPPRGSVPPCVCLIDQQQRDWVAVFEAYRLSNDMDEIIFEKFQQRKSNVQYILYMYPYRVGTELNFFFFLILQPTTTYHLLTFWRKHMTHLIKWLVARQPESSSD